MEDMEVSEAANMDRCKEAQDPRAKHKALMASCCQEFDVQTAAALGLQDGSSLDLEPKWLRSSFSFVIVHKIGSSFGTISIKPFKSLVRAFQSQSQLNNILTMGGAEGRPPSLLFVHWPWL